EGRQLLLARHAPRGPEVDDDDVAAEVRQLHLRAVEPGEREIAGAVAHLRARVGGGGGAEEGETQEDPHADGTARGRHRFTATSSSIQSFRLSGVSMSTNWWPFRYSVGVPSRCALVPSSLFAITLASVAGSLKSFSNFTMSRPISFA